MPCGRFGGACAPFAPPPPLGPALRMLFFLLIKVEMPTIVEYEKRFITSGPDLNLWCLHMR